MEAENSRRWRSALPPIHSCHVGLILSKRHHSSRNAPWTFQNRITLDLITIRRKVVASITTELICTGILWGLYGLEHRLPTTPRRRPGIPLLYRDRRHILRGTM